MKPRTVAVLLILLLALVFAALNWNTFNQSTSLNVVVGTVEAPLGMLMLGAIAALSIVYLVLLARVEAESMLDSRRRGKELEKARKVAESSEASRIKDLKEEFERGFKELTARLDDIADRFETESLREAIEDETDGLEDRIEEAEDELKKQIIAGQTAAG